MSNCEGHRVESALTDEKLQSRTIKVLIFGVKYRALSVHKKYNSAKDNWNVRRYTISKVCVMSPGLSIRLLVDQARHLMHHVQQRKGHTQQLIEIHIVI